MRGLCVLHYDDIFVFEKLFVFFGEVVVGYKHVDVFEAGEGVGINLADFRAVEHHIHVTRFLKHLL